MSRFLDFIQNNQPDFISIWHTYIENVDKISIIPIVEHKVGLYASTFLHISVFKQNFFFVSKGYVDWNAVWSGHANSCTYLHHMEN